MTPRVAAIVPLFVSLERHAGLFSPAFRLGVVTTPSVSASLAGGEANLMRVTGKMEACPLRWRWLDRWSLWPCLAVEAGAIVADSQGLFETAQQTSAWVGVDGTARLGFDLTDWLALQIQGGAGASLLRPRFVVDRAAAADAVGLSEVFGTFSGGLHVQFR